MWYDRALQSRELQLHTRLQTLMFLGQIAEVKFLEQHRSKRMRVGEYLYRKADADVWYGELLVSAVGTYFQNASEFRMAEFNHLAAELLEGIC